MKKYITTGNIEIIKVIKEMPYKNGINNFITKLDTHKGMLLASNFEYPSRYTRGDIGFINPPVQITVYKDNLIIIEALNERGVILLSAINSIIAKLTIIENFQESKTKLSCTIKKNKEKFSEEDRSKQPSIFSILREIINLFSSKEDIYLGLYGAFGYDLAFQFEEIEQYIKRDDKQRDLVLYLPDEILVVDHYKETISLHCYDFKIKELTTTNKNREGIINSYKANLNLEEHSDHILHEYVDTVKKAKKYFKCGDLFEVVPGQTFSSRCEDSPSVVFQRLKTINPAPYSFLINLGENEYLVGASPEMYVRVTEKRVETCPISGTIARGTDAITDAGQILTLLNSKKDHAELTMCTDVDRNDKSRICKAGSVKVIGRRHIEIYSRLIHTVDHVEGELRDGYDAIDAFLTHAWAVTVTGAPKLKAMQFLEKHEKSPRLWYGGAIGVLNFSGNMNTGLTIRTIRIKDGIAQIRAGATLLYDSIPEEEEKEIRLKASTLLSIIRKNNHPQVIAKKSRQDINVNKKILLIDHQDSFVHTLANYLRQTGALVTTLRFGINENDLIKLKPDLVVLSPGPGKPSEFNLHKTIQTVLKYDTPIFGVCLGLQGIVEYFGGRLNTLDYPMHGKSVMITNTQTHIFKRIPKNIIVGLYHSLYADEKSFPPELSILARSEQGIIMAIAHKKLPIFAVQFHPESILSMDDNIGYKIIENLLNQVN